MKQLSKRLTNLEDKVPVRVATARDSKATPEECAAVYHKIMSEARAMPDDGTINGKKVNNVFEAAREYFKLIKERPKRHA